ncbi:acyl-ACP--UDP-N-acetylglucosamine O-acyltransferase [bacterium]|nr:acyl-ACP--UDP-N-acetylglucosamine O-acyltransferase [bacterium]
MTVSISPLADVSPRAELGSDVTIGPFCVVGPHVVIGDGCLLDSHVSIQGHTTVGTRNRFWPGAVIGAEPQDIGYKDGPTRVEIGDENTFREGVTVNRGADKEDGVTRIGHRNFLMANAHVAHNCHVFNNTILCNGVLLGGHVHVHDFAIVSGNSVVHHFATIGTSAFVSGGCRVPQDIAPFMLAAGSDNPEIMTVNLVGMRRRGFAESSIQQIKQAFKLLYREHKSHAVVRQHFEQQTSELPSELMLLLDFVERSAQGKSGRAREAIRNQPQTDSSSVSQRRAA